VDHTAIIATNGQLATPYAKTAHGLIRGSSRYEILGVIDSPTAGKDAGEVLDGVHRAVPIFASLQAACAGLDRKPGNYIIGYAAPGGQLPEAYRGGIVEALEAGLTVVSGMHQFLSEDPEFAEAARKSGAAIYVVRKRKAPLHFWNGTVLSVGVPRLAVLGTDCAVGKRTTARILVETCLRHNLRAEFISTGQTGWLQGARHGFILDATLNDFVCGELEHAIVSAAAERALDLLVLEGQSALRHPAGPCGAEFIVSGGARAVILQHAPGRSHFEGYEKFGLRIPPVSEEIQLIRLLGAQTLAIALNGERLSPAALRKEQARLAEETGVPVVLPLEDGLDALVPQIRSFLSEEAAA